MKALSWKPPFGVAMLYGKIETRTWDTKYRGLVLICTSKKGYDVEDLEEISGYRLFSNMTSKTKHDLAYDLFGYAIAVGELIDSRPMTVTDQEQAFVLYDPMLWCHVYKNVRGIKPFPWKGSMGWRNVSPEIESQIIYTDI